MRRWHGTSAAIGIDQAREIRSNLFSIEKLFEVPNKSNSVVAVKYFREALTYFSGILAL